MHDWRNPALTIAASDLFSNQLFVRNTFMPSDNIKKIENLGKDYHIRFYDDNAVIGPQLFLFWPIIKANFKQEQIFILNIFNAGDIDGFMKILE